MLVLIDEFNVTISEKSIIEEAIRNNCTNTFSLVVINNDKNI